MPIENTEFLLTLITIGGFFLSIVGLFIWNRTESRTDTRHMDQKLDAFRVETISILSAIQQEMKDFHGRLCVIEERNKKE
jgi:hypothetical protein